MHLACNNTVPLTQRLLKDDIFGKRKQFPFLWTHAANILYSVINA